MLKLLKNCLYVIVLSIILCSCGSGNGGNKKSLTLTSITIDQAPTVNTNVGLKTKITATAHYADNSIQTIPSTELTLVSANSNIASISTTLGSNDIFVMGVAAGETTITASFNGVSSSNTTVKVSAAALQSITIDQGSTIDTNVGLKTKVTATAHFSDNTTQPINSSELTLVSADSKIASISTRLGSNDIFVVGVAAGQTTITASFNGIKSNETTVKVGDAIIQSIVIDQGPTLSLKVGDLVEVTATAHLSYNTTQPILNRELIWVSTNPEIAEISTKIGSSDIFVKGIAANDVSTTITASYDGITSEPVEVLVTNQNLTNSK
ncbi:MAG TPA: hypothetical protein PKD00_10500 [Burkholderiales bacterium]|nr:hypothetical protein [Burkholderiales bacterium]